jgi:putative endopeptidase
MVKTQRRKITNHNVTKRSPLLIKTRSLDTKCPVNFKPFEEEFSKTIPQSQLIKSNEQKKSQFVKEVTARFTPKNIQPNNDFYDYINYGWLKNVSLEKQQDYIVQVDDFRLAQDKVYHELNELILNYIKTHNNPLSKNLKNYYTTVVNMNPIDQSKKLAIESVKTIDDLIQSKNMWKMLAFFNKDEMIAGGAPFVWSLNPDDKDPDTFRCSISAHSFFTLDLHIYYDDGTDVDYKKKYRKAFKKTCNLIFDTCLGKGHGFNGSDVYDVEIEMFTALGCTDFTTKAETSYNKVTANDAMTKCGFDWKEFCKELGFSNTPPFFITTSLNYLKCGTDLMAKNWDSAKWRTYWIYILLRRLIRITRKWETVPFSFSGKFERGQRGINKTDAVSASLYMSVPFNTFLTNEYVDKYGNPEAVEYVRLFCNDLKLVYRRIIQRNQWMSPNTRKAALNKLDHFAFIIGKPENLREDPDLDYGNKSLYENMRKINNWRFNNFLKLEGKPVIDIPMMDWAQYPVKMSGSQAYIVNASYTPSKNKIYINLGYIQKPFVDLDERGIEYNLAHLGFTIGHEMSHGFDDWGSQYDETGKLHDWWTAEDKKKFKEIQNDVIKQYEEFAARDGIKFDASIGVGEDMADISGLSIVTEFLRDFQENNKDLVPISYLSFQILFTYYAFQQKQKVSKKALSAQLKTNPHPLDKYRCNIPLSRNTLFRSIYDVKKGDGMWWHNTNTVM